mgnify:FL=1
MSRRRDLHATRRRAWPASLALVLLVLVGAAPACERTPSSPGDATAEPAGGPLTLDRLQDGDGAKSSGAALMALPPGMHRLDTSEPAPLHAVIGVHGYDSGGYEWVHPLKVLGGDGKARVFFHRYDWNQCPEPVAATLEKSTRGYRSGT